MQVNATGDISAVKLNEKLFLTRSRRYQDGYRHGASGPQTPQNSRNPLIAKAKRVANPVDKTSS